MMIPLDSPFHPDNEAGYQTWRTTKLDGYPARGEELIVEVKDPHRLSDAEYTALWQRIAKANMAIYATRLGESDDKVAVKALSAAFGLTHLDANWLADEDGISARGRRSETRRVHSLYPPPHPLAYRRLLQSAGTAYLGHDPALRAAGGRGGRERPL
jgi:hypothetical protein